MFSYAGHHQIILADFYEEWARWYGRCEMKHKDFWLGEPRAGVILDVGANIGIFSVLFSKLFDTVHAFEPIEESRAKMAKNLEANGCANVHLYPLAVGDKTGKYQDIVAAKWEIENVDKVFDFTTLDDWIAANPMTVAAIKIDTDGYDYEVLRGAHDLLLRDRPVVVVELSAHAFSTRGQSVEAAKDYLTSLGYVGRYLDDDNWVYEPIKTVATQS